MNRKKALQILQKQANEKASIKKIAQEAPDTNDVKDHEEYAKKALQQMLEDTEIDFPTDLD